MGKTLLFLYNVPPPPILRRPSLLKSDMHEHPWLQKIHLVAYCPKCQAPSLRRGHAKTRIELYRKRHSEKRLFVCTQCGWKGWAHENQLNYPAAEVPQYEFNDQIESTIPEGLLQELPSGESSTDAHRRSSPPLEPGKSAGTTPPRAAPSHFDDHIPDVSLHGEIDPPVEHGHVENDPDEEDLHDREFSFPFEDDPTPLHEEETWGAPPPIDETPVFVSTHSKKEKRKHTGRECPRCGEEAVHRSHHRGLIERIRKFLTGKRVYRCHACEWRGWMSRTQ